MRLIQVEAQEFDTLFDTRLEAIKDRYLAAIMAAEPSAVPDLTRFYDAMVDDLARLREELRES